MIILNKLKLFAEILKVKKSLVTFAQGVIQYINHFELTISDEFHIFFFQLF